MANPEMGPQEPEEEISQEDVEEIERASEMAPEDFQEMLSQIPALKEMLVEREKKLQTSVNPEEIEILQTEIEELREEIISREDFLE